VHVKKDTQVQAELLGTYGVEMQDTHGLLLSGTVLKTKEKTKQTALPRAYGLVANLM
jgi:hypothetical protein